MKNQSHSNLLVRSSLALTLALVLWVPVQAQSAAPAEGKMMTDNKTTEPHHAMTESQQAMSDAKQDANGGTNDPLHGITLAMIVDTLVERHGWEELGQLIDVRCFQLDPSVSSSLKFLRRTPWARKKVEDLYLYGPATR